MRKRKFKIKKVLIIAVLLVLGLGVYFSYNKIISFFKGIKYQDGFIASDISKVTLYDLEFVEKEDVARGNKIIYSYQNKYTNKEDKNSTNEYYRVVYKNSDYYVNVINVVKEKDNILFEKEVFVRTSQNLYKDIDGGELLGLVNKGDALLISGFDSVNDEGVVNMYKVKSNDMEGYIYSKYTVFSKDESLLNYDQDGMYQVHLKRGNTYGGGNAGNLDYFPYTKAKFSDNVMPSEVRALYLNGTSGVISNVDSYIEFAKSTKINAFVVDIKDNAQPAYQSEVFKVDSPTNYKYAFNTIDEYKSAIDKIKNAGFYVIGRITTFKDIYYASDHNDYAITNTNTNSPLYHQSSYWPSPYRREVWKFNVDLAKEAVSLFGFNEIQFDYVRFPDGTKKYETASMIDYRNTYGEEKAQAIQRYLMYATDELHKMGVYVSADVFGESSYTYVTAYGQYFPAISNIVDVISAMPYPDHFNKYDFGFDEVVWTVPYKLLNYWGSVYVMKRQGEIPTPAICRTWIQTYNSIKAPYVTYDASKVSDQIRGLYDAGLDGGYMTWNSASSLTKYKSQADAYNKEYK